ncbi:MAG: hypothetical protein ACJ8EY_03495, partial [Sphingomicrobium sp.]
MKFLFLAPAPDYPEDWSWAFEPQAKPLVDRGATVETQQWSEARDLGDYDLILPLICWGYHLRFGEWLSFLDRLEKDQLPVINPPRLLRWNSDKAYLAELIEQGVPTVPSVAVDACTDADLQSARARFGTGEIV